MADNQTQIILVKPTNLTTAGTNQAASSGGTNGKNIVCTNPNEAWNVIIKTEVFTKNSILRPDGFSCIWFENTGEDKCYIFDSVPVFPESMVRRFDNRPGEIITTQIPIQFEKRSANTRLLITKIYYQKI